MNPYDDVLMDHIKNARNYRVLDDASHTAHGTNPLCGDEVTVYANVPGEHVDTIAFQCTCCGISMASASIMTVVLAGRPVEEVCAAIPAFRALLERQPEGGAETGDAHHSALVDAVRRFPARLRCALLPWVTLEAALRGHAEASFTR